MTRKAVFHDTGSFDDGSPITSFPSAVASVFGRTGTVVATAGDYFGAMPAALTGATQAARFVGATTSGAPASGTFAVGDVVVARDGHVFVCTSAGTPGTWVDVGGGGTGGTPTDGWVDDTAHTWTYASASTFTIAGVDLTSVFTPGTRLKFTQTTVKYGIVASSSFSTNTTVTIIVNTDYVLANAAISANYYSYVANPQGYPGWFNYTSGCAGFSSLSTNDARFAVNGRVCQLAVHFIGTSNATTFTFNLPVACVVAEQFNYWLVLSNDNSVTAVRRLAFATTTSGRFDSALNANNGWNSGGGTKSAVIDLSYEF